MSDLWSKPKSLRDVADDIANQIGDDPDSGAVDPSMMQPVANAAAPTNPPHVNAFFDNQIDRIGNLADEMGVPKNLMLGLSAAESSWGRPTGQNNLFGFTRNHQVVDYPSFDASIDDFRKSPWYSRLQGKTNTDDFINELVDNRGGKLKFNTDRKDYDDYVRGVIASVDRRLPIWERSR